MDEGAVAFDARPTSAETFNIADSFESFALLQADASNCIYFITTGGKSLAKMNRGKSTMLLEVRMTNFFPFNTFPCELRVRQHVHHDHSSSPHSINYISTEY